MGCSPLYSNTMYSNLFQDASPAPRPVAPNGWRSTVLASATEPQIPRSYMPPQAPPPPAGFSRTTTCAESVGLCPRLLDVQNALLIRVHSRTGAGWGRLLSVGRSRTRGSSRTVWSAARERRRRSVICSVSASRHFSPVKLMSEISFSAVGIACTLSASGDAIVEPFLVI